jgi:type I restriction enzyme S subunit
MKKYQSYKPSGVEWIGEIPESWDKKRLKNLTKSINGFSFKSDDFDREFDIPVIRIGDVSDVIDFDSCVKVKSHFLEDKKDFLIEKNDILIGMTGGTIGKSGKYNYDFPSLLNQRVGLLRNNNLLLNGLLYHYIKSDIFIRYIFYYCYGGGQDNISMNDILNMFIPYPPLQEQEQIVNYLDEKTTIIDKLISIKQRKVELLKEQRTTLINQVITKGLNPKVKMKDSGVEWIGEIPDSWSFGRLGYYSNVYRGSGYQYLNQVDDDFNGRKEKVIRISDMTEFNPIWCEYLVQFENYRIQKNDILMGGTGHYFGNSIFVNEEMEGLIHSYNIIRIIIKKQNPRYIQYYISSSIIREQMDLSVLGSGQPFIDLQGLKDTLILIPTIQEQQEIVEYLDKHTKEIDDLVSMEQNKIELLKEYRQSLISEVITGKIKVV